MSDLKPDVTHTLFGKTELGLQEIQSRALRLGPIMRRTLILVDGKRSFEELSTFLVGHNLSDILLELQTLGCIEAKVKLPAAAAPQKVDVPNAKSENDLLATLPEASTRTSKDVDMARNFMMNTVNTVFQQNTRLTLMEAIFACKSVDDVRRVYPKWADAMSASAIGTKRLPEFREKLFQVL